MLDVIMFIPNIFPTLLHKKLGWGTQNKNHLTLLYKRNAMNVYGSPKNAAENLLVEIECCGESPNPTSCSWRGPSS
jgi:hypothetical protein